MTRVLVLGASRWQVPLIRAGQALGLQVAATDRNPDAVGAVVADRFAPIDLKDVVGTIAYARELGISAVTTDQTDLPIPTIAAVNEALSLRGPDRERALNVTNKRRMRELASAAGVPVAQYQAVHPGEVLQWPEWGSARLVVKPADSMGSRGVQVIEDQGMLVSAVELALSHSPSGEALIEEFIAGTEVTIEGFVDATGPRILAISEKRHSPPPHRTAWHLTFPPRMPAALLARIEATAIRTASALGITDGPLHGEFMVTPEGQVVLIEMANRGGGSGTSSHIVPAASGVDLLSLHWQQLLGEPVICAPTRHEAVLLRFLCYPPGVVTAIHGLAEAQALPGTVFCELYCHVGDTLGTVTNDTERHGCAIVRGATHAEAESALVAVMDTLRVDIDGRPAVDLYTQAYGALVC